MIHGTRSSPVHQCRCGVLRPERWTAVAHAVYAKAKEGGRYQRQQHGPGALQEVWLEVLAGHSAPRTGHVLTF